ncbi:MAG: hypothetical protein ACK8QZ_12565, partial [Anaerolineales bacterium]
ANCLGRTGGGRPDDGFTNAADPAAAAAHSPDARSAGGEDDPTELSEARKRQRLANEPKQP